MVLPSLTISIFWDGKHIFVADGLHLNKFAGHQLSANIKCSLSFHPNLPSGHNVQVRQRFDVTIILVPLSLTA